MLKKSDSIQLLLVDDEVDQLELMQLAFDDKYQFKTASTAKDAKNLTETWEPHIVITDYSMPGESGLELLSYLKTKYPDLPVIIVTGMTDRNIAIGAVKKGAYDYIEKPYFSEDLEVSIERAIKHRLLLIQREEHISQLREGGVELLTLTKQLIILEKEKRDRK